MRKLFLALISILLTPAVLASSLTDCSDAIPGNATNRYVDQNDGTVQDRITGLIWQRCEFGTTWNASTYSCDGSPTYLNWVDALNQIVTFNSDELAAGRAYDWRMPNIKELSSIVNLQCAYMAIDNNAFPNAGTTYWTSTPYVSSTVEFVQYADANKTIISGYNDENGAWSVNFATGREQGDAIYSTTLLVRLVRGSSQPPATQ